VSASWIVRKFGLTNGSQERKTAGIIIVMTAREIYENSVAQLPPADRLRLAAWILDDLVASDGAGLDIRDDWSNQDVADLTAYSLKHADASAP
jgi:hypothetical protein